MLKDLYGVTHIIRNELILNLNLYVCFENKHINLNSELIQTSHPL